MGIQIRLRRQLSLSLLTMTIASVSMSQEVFGQSGIKKSPTQSPANREVQNDERKVAESQTTNPLDERSDEESLDLGVITASCPANAVCVKQVLQHSPADEAGIQAGDYLLTIDGKQVSTPSGLNKLIAGMARDKEVKLKVWRQGKEIECVAHLASNANELPKCHDAWLGVMLSNEKEGGVKIQHVISGSPASKSKLVEGDMLRKVGNIEIKDVQTFLGKIEEMGPEDSIQLTVRRDGKDHEVAVTLGSFCDAPMAFVKHLHSQHHDSHTGGQQSENASIELMDRALDDMRNRIRELRDEVRELKGAQPSKAAKPVAAKPGDISALPKDSDFKFVSQIQVQIPLLNNRQQNFGQGYNPYRNNYYGQYGQNVQRYSPYYGNGFQTPYGGNNYYYRYNNQPYYYGGNNNNWYGNRPRPGIQIGPNTGVYWY